MSKGHSMAMVGGGGGRAIGGEAIVVSSVSEVELVGVVQVCPIGQGMMENKEGDI